MFADAHISSLGDLCYHLIIGKLAHYVWLLYQNAPESRSHVHVPQYEIMHYIFRFSVVSRALVISVKISHY